MDKPKLTLDRPLSGRVSERRSVRCDVTLSSSTNFYVGTTLNISDGGIFVASQEPLTIGSLVTLRFTLPGDGSVIEATGEVRWARPASESEGAGGYGVRFMNLPMEDAARIRAFVEARKPILQPDE